MSRRGLGAYNYEDARYLFYELARAINLAMRAYQIY